MPWCEECAKYWAPSAMNDDGSCPSCGRDVEAAMPKVTPKNLNLRKLAAGEGVDEDDMKAPWHFKLLMVLLAGYLGWRIVQLFV